jgi:hypothetical protein
MTGKTQRKSEALGDKIAKQSDFKPDGAVSQSTKDMLDEFIEATFPASDPFCLSNPIDRVGGTSA